MRLLYALVIITLLLVGCGHPAQAPTPFPTAIRESAQSITLPPTSSPLMPPTPTPPTSTPGPIPVASPLPIRISPSPSPALWPTPSPLPSDVITRILTPVTTPLPKPPRSSTRLQDYYLRLVTHLVNRFHGDLGAVQRAYLAAVTQAWEGLTSDRIPQVVGVHDDLDGDGEEELLVFVPLVGEQCGIASQCPYIGVLFEQEQAFWAPRVVLTGKNDMRLSLVRVRSISDANNDGKAEVVFLSEIRGAHTDFVQVWIGQWGGEVWRYLMAHPVVMAFARVEMRDWDGNGLVDILVRGGIVASVGAGLQREHTLVLAWRHGAYQIIADVPEASDHPYFLMLDANWALANREWQRAEGLAANAWVGLQTAWDAPDTFPGEEDEWLPPQPHRSRLLAYVGIERMLALLALGRENQAHAVLVDLEATAQASQNPYRQAARRLWETYLRTGDLVTACTAMERDILAHPESIAFYPWYGYNMERLGAENVCPLDGRTLPVQDQFWLRGIRGPVEGSP